MEIQSQQKPAAEVSNISPTLSQLSAALLAASWGHVAGHIKVMSIRLWWRRKYPDPLTQTIILGLICFCIPGMFNALNGLGAAGKADATTTDNANTALAVAGAVCAILAGGLFNLFGHYVLLILGGSTYILYIGSYLSYNSIFVITAGGILGVGASFLWAAQGAMIMSYPEEGKKGRYFSVFWAIFNCGAIIGSIISLIIEWHNGTSQVSTHTYIAFMVVTGFGCSLTLLLLPPTRVIREDGSQVTLLEAPHVQEEAMGILNLFRDWRMLCLIPMFLSANWYYTYQFNVVNGGGIFTTRTRALNGTLYWFAQILSSVAMGQLLDCKHMDRRIRAFVGLAALFVLTMVIWGGGFAFQRTFTRTSVKSLIINDKINFSNSRRYAGPVVLYALYGAFDTIWQTYCYWLMGALTNNTRMSARYSGFYKAIQNAGAGCAGQVDAKKTAFLTELLINWGLLILGIICAIPVAGSVQETLQADTPKDGTDVTTQKKLDEMTSITAA